jgi:hypothetical protein
VDHENWLPSALLVIAALPDAFPNEKLDPFTRIRPHRREVRDCMVNREHVALVLFFRVSERAQSNEAAPECALRKTSKGREHASSPFQEWCTAWRHLPGLNRRVNARRLKRWSSGNPWIQKGIQTKLTYLGGFGDRSAKW